MFVGSVPNVPGCYAQGATLDELIKNLREVFVLCIRNTQVTLSEFVGVQKIEIAV